MENATKALEMAGSVLIGVLILGCLVFAYTRMTELKDIEHQSEVSQQATDFNQDYEAYNRNNLYGTDMFSLANQIANYNNKEADVKGYESMEMKIILKTSIIGASFFTDMSYNETTLNQKYKLLSNAINQINTEYFGKSVSYWANYGTGSRLDSQLQQEVSQNISESKKSELKNKIAKYKDYLNEQKDMARKSFKCTSVEYYNTTGRIKYMEFTEK